jgi:hypothetical protein
VVVVLLLLLLYLSVVRLRLLAAHGCPWHTLKM